MIPLEHRDHIAGPATRREFLRSIAAGSLCMAQTSFRRIWANTLSGADDSPLITGELKSWQSHPRLRRLEVAFRFLQRTDLKTLTVGKHLIDGEKVYALVDKSPSVPPETAEFESHRKYIDVHYLLAGQAMTGFAPVEKLQVIKPYEEKTDAASYSIPESYSKLKMVPGKFAVFFPGGGHMPWCHLDGPHELHRVVVKVQYDYGLK